MDIYTLNYNVNEEEDLRAVVFWGIQKKPAREHPKEYFHFYSRLNLLKN